MPSPPSTRPRPAASLPPAAARSRAVGLVGGASLLAVLAAVTAGPWLTAAGPALLVVAGVVGLPHGAVDLLLLGRDGGRATRRSLAVYAAAAAGAAVLAVVAPVPVVLALLVLSVLHFAEGEQGFAALLGRPLPSVTAAALGAAVVAFPLLLHPAASRPLLAALDPSLPDVLSAVRAPVLLVTAVAVLAGVVAAVRAGHRRGALELAVVTAGAALAPALVFFALWFAGWHAARHLVRVAALPRVGGGRRMALAAAWPTAAAVLGIGALALLLGGLPSAVLVVLLALTVPHAAVVAGMERQLGSLRSA